MSTPKDRPGDAGRPDAAEDPVRPGVRQPDPPEKEKVAPKEPEPEDPKAEEERKAAEERKRRAEEERDEAVKELRGSEDPLSRAESARINEMLDEAFRRFAQRGPDLHMKVNFFQDSVEFGGGLNMGGPGPGSAPDGRVELGAAWMSAHVEHYVRPDRFEDALRVLAEHRLLLLTDLPGTGRTAGAVNLLTSAAVEDSPCYLLNASGELADASWEPPVKHACYLVELGDAPGRAPVRPEDLDNEWIERIAARLRAAAGHMVVLTGPAGGMLAEAAVHSPCVLDSLGALDHMEIIVRRVLGPEPDPNLRAELVAQVTGAGGTELLAESPEPRMAVHLANALRDGKDLAAIVAEVRNPSLRVRSWFGRHRDPAATAFMLSAAVLEDITYLTVSDAAFRLYKLLAPIPEDEGPPRLRFRERLGTDHPWIVLTDPVRRGDPQRVRFVDPTLRESVLEYAWLHLDGEREALLQWIRRLVNDPDHEVRANTAVSISLFARHDHVHAVRRYLRPWAGDDSTRVRESAARTLAMLGADPDLVELVWAELDLWTDDVNPSLRRRTTAAAAVGGPLGAKRPEQAFRILRRSLDDDKWRGLVAAAEGVSRLVELQRETQALQALVTWSDPEGDPDLVQQSLFVFVSAAFTPLPWARHPDGGPGAPLVIADGGRNRRRLTRLLGRALNNEVSRDYALGALRRCLTEHADRDPAGSRALGELLLDVAALGPRQAKRITWHLDRWARDPSRPSSAARTIHTALTHLNSTRTSP